MKYFYATRNDKNGNKITTSYAKLNQAEKYGGAGCSIWEGAKFLDEKGKVTERETGQIVRSRLAKTSGGSSLPVDGKFRLVAVYSDGLVDTGMRFTTYGAANTTMKSLIDAYPELMVVEVTGAQEEARESTIVDGEDPF